ncbi:G patch domain-containing protein 4 [Sabethes cyaneus]|uniref:G patch domain-containing protein 4 n=1 Tax=Sabethes cyaneus TaxID=53552 RepID=UPI00237D49CC|nr:G patch domain-containing protein 4 [Sabethes cyaneus]
MDFAKNVLQKYGWREGEGLGKNSNGITKPIKASLKFNNTGFGANPAQEHTNKWWERVFDEAASNLVVGPAGTITQREKDAVEISNKSYSVRKLKQQTQADGKGNYSGFLKASTLLTNVGREEELAGHVRTEDIEFKPAKVLTDEELFAACGGRTAHKGARHGLKLSGKLARLEAQDNKLLKELESKSFESVIKSNDWKEVKRRKKSKKKKRNEEKWTERHQQEEDDELKDMIHNTNYVVKKNKKKVKEAAHVELDLVDGLEQSMGFFDTLPEDEGVEPDPQPTVEDELKELTNRIRKLDHNSITIKKKDKKKKQKLKTTLQTNDKSLDDDESMDPTAKYRKDYKKKQKLNNKLLRELVSDEVPQSKTLKPKKLLKSDSDASDSSDEERQDVVDKINDQRQKMKPKLPRIKVIEATEEDQQMLAEQFKQRHRNRNKRVGRHKAKRPKSKKRDRKVALLADELLKNL